MTVRIDHLVIAADTLQQGAAWCEATLGAAPAAGGRHPLMGTHNRLLRIDGPAFERCYLEIIAIDPSAAPPGRSRWFGLDDPDLQQAIRSEPRFIHAVARTTDIEMLRWGLINCRVDPGTLLAAHRDTPAGRLAWRITVRDDGELPESGALPTLIEWQGPHPCERMAASPVQLTSLSLRTLPPRVRELLRLAPGTKIDRDDAPALLATLDTPRGEVELRSWR
ncbi:MAG: VOC family protein [Burkholderiaceae bacterium]